jgi:hypothetical protein
VANHIGRSWHLVEAQEVRTVASTKWEPKGQELMRERGEARGAGDGGNQRGDWRSEGREGMIYMENGSR